MLAAVPLVLAGDQTPSTSRIDATPPNRWVSRALFTYAHDVLYADQHADRRLYSARFAIVVLGLLLGVLIFAWANAWLGYWPAVAALAMYALEPNLLAHASLVTTDFGVTAFVFAALYYLWRVQRHPTTVNITALVLAFACAQLTKFSGLALVPIIALLLAVVVENRSLRWTTAASIVGAMAVVTFAAIWLVYGMRFTPGANDEWLFRVYDDPVVRERVPLLTSIVQWVDTHRLLPNAYANGLLLSQAKAQVRDAFLAGQFSETGWWYYFPVAFLLKTPIALIVAAILGTIVLVSRRASLGIVNAAFVAVPAAVFAAIAVATPLNIGLRHVLPLYPFVILLAAAGVSELGRRSDGRMVLGILAVFWCLEFARAYPHPIAFFNAFAGGPQNGYRFLVDSNLDWGQDLKPLKRWMDEQGVRQIALGYFGTADAAYYGIRYTPLPGSGFYAGGPLVAPVLPGYVAVSATLLNGVYLDQRERAFYAPLRATEPLATIGFSINVYRVDRPWWQ